MLFVVFWTHPFANHFHIRSCLDQSGRSTRHTHLATKLYLQSQAPARHLYISERSQADAIKSAQPYRDTSGRRTKTPTCWVEHCWHVITHTSQQQHECEWWACPQSRRACCGCCTPARQSGAKISESVAFESGLPDCRHTVTSYLLHPRVRLHPHLSRSPPQLRRNRHNSTEEVRCRSQPLF